MTATTWNGKAPRPPKRGKPPVWADPYLWAIVAVCVLGPLLIAAVA